MKFANHKVRLTMCGVALAGITLAVVAATPAQDAKSRQPAAPAQAAPGTPDQHDMSAMMPNDHHKKLAHMVGNWTADVTMMMGEGMPPVKNTGTVKIESIMGGRFVMSTVHGGPVPGMGNFEGIGISGYNNRTGKYENSWLDNTSTELTKSTGEDDPATGDIMWHSEAPNMMTGKIEPNRSTMTKNSDDKYTWTTFTTTDGKEWKSMEIVYTRAK